MCEEKRPARLQDFIQGGLILVLIVLLLFVGSIATGYMVRAEHSENKEAVARLHYEQMLDAVSTDLKMRIDRVQDTAQNDSLTENRRIRLLEARVDRFETELAAREKQFNKLKN